MIFLSNGKRRAQFGDSAFRPWSGQHQGAVFLVIGKIAAIEDFAIDELVIAI